MEENKDLNIEQPEAEEFPAETPAEEAGESIAEKLPVEEEEQEILDALTGAAQTAPLPKKDWKKELREWVVSIGIALLVVFVIRSFLFQIIRVDGESMFSTLLDNERLFVTVYDVKLHGVNRGDIVICHYPNRGNTNFVKRAVGVPGDSVYRENGVTHVVYEAVDANGAAVTVDEMLDERYAAYFPNGSTDDYEPYVLGENEYFVVGDNRYNSHDSRDWNDAQQVNDVGPITGDMLVGRVRRVIWPLSNIRSVAQ